MKSVFQPEAPVTIVDLHKDYYVEICYSLISTAGLVAIHDKETETHLTTRYFEIEKDIKQELIDFARDYISTIEFVKVVSKI